MTKASDHYNLACAYALWSLEPGEQEPAALRDGRSTTSTRAVNEQWTDVGWMEQDKDLDPIRDTPKYREIVERAEDDRRRRGPARGRSARTAVQSGPGILRRRGSGDEARARRAGSRR